MASIFTLPPLEEGGSIARGAFGYQDYVAAALCLEMLRTQEIQAIWCETHDDLLFEKVVKGDLCPEFIQVKSDAFDQLWSVAKLCERESRNGKPSPDSSIVERQLARDRGDEIVYFRLVTLRDVKDELSVLKVAPDSRDRAKVEDISAALVKRLGNSVSPKGRSLDYWAANVRWDVRESLQALENANLRDLDDYLDSELKQPTMMVDRRRLYAELVEMTRRAAEARWSVDRERKRISREQLIAWIKNEVSRLQPAISVQHSQEIASLERESIGRCETRWRAIGLPLDIALNLANDPQVGAPSADLLAALSRPFAWLVGGFGSGKSLAMDRLYQQQLSAFRSQAVARIPVFLDGKSVIGKCLRNEAEQRARKLGNLDQGVVLLLDGIDEAGSMVAANLLNDAYILSRTWQGSSVIVSSIPLLVSGYERDQVALPALSKTSARDLIRKLIGSEISAIHRLPDVFHNDVDNPLFAVLLAMSLRQYHRMPGSTGELIADVAKRALQPLVKDFEKGYDLLVRKR